MEKEKKLKDRKLNTRERKFIKNLAQGMSMTTAMRQAGYSENTARCKAGIKVKESRIAIAFNELMERAGITDEKLASTLHDGLNATRIDLNNAEVKIPDFLARYKFLDAALKIKRHYPPDRQELSGPNGKPVKIEHGIIILPAKEKI